MHRFDLRRGLAVLLLSPVVSVWAKGPNLPAMPADAPVYVSPVFPASGLKFSAYSVPDSYFGLSSYKQGSATLGVLFGPLGAAANAARLRSDAKAMSSSGTGLFDTDLGALLTEIDPAIRRDPPSDGTWIELTPAVGYVFSSETEFNINCFLQSTVVKGGKRSAKYRYGVWRSVRHATTEPDVVARTQTYFRQCFTQNLQLFSLIRTQGVAALRPAMVRLNTWKKPIEWQVVHAVLPDRLAYDADGAIYDLDMSDVASIEPLPAP